MTPLLVETRADGQLVVPLLLSGTGIAVAIPAIPSIVIGSVASHRVGKASETLRRLRQLGGVFGVAAVHRAGSYTPTQAFSDGFRPLVHFRVTPTTSGRPSVLADEPNPAAGVAEQVIEGPTSCWAGS